MADNTTLPFGIQSEYDRLVMRGGPTPQLDAARTCIAELLAMGPVKAERFMWAFYRAFDGGPTDVVNNTEEVEHHAR